MKKGFTLSEILITMGIIGVAAALVFPNLTAKINRNTVGITLARAVELTEKGFGDILNVARENATAVGIEDPASISRISVLELRFFDRIPQDNGNLLSGGGLMQSAQSYIGIDAVPQDNWTNNYLNDIGAFGNSTIYRFKKLNAFLVFDDDNSNDNNIADNPDVVIRRIYFDTNGAAAPNAIGEDIFLFGLTDSGHLVPAGTEAFRTNIWGNSTINILALDFENPNADPNVTCIGDAIPAQGQNVARLSCTARVVQDGWKINYSY